MPCIWNPVPTNFFGYQQPKKGKAYAGIFVYDSPPDPNRREYLQGKFTTALETGKKYCFEFFVCFTPITGYAIKEIGVHFSKDSIFINDYHVAPLTPHFENDVIVTDTMNWTSVAGEFVSQDNERYMIIGNFNSDANTTTTYLGYGTTYQNTGYYLIDDVNLYEWNSIPSSISSGDDTIICLGETVTLGTPAVQGYSYLWQGPGIVDPYAAEITVTPSTSTFYVLTVTDTMPKPYTCKTEAWDTVTVTVIDCDTLGNVVWLPNIFSPNGDGQNDVLYVRGSNINELNFTIFDRWGEQVFGTIIIDNGWDGTYFGQRVNDGVFVYYATGTYTDGTPFDIKSNVTLVR